MVKQALSRLSLVPPRISLQRWCQREPGSGVSPRCKQRAPTWCVTLPDRHDEARKLYLRVVQGWVSDQESQLSHASRTEFRGGRSTTCTGMENMRHALTILAYDMNGALLGVLHDAPLRLRCENEQGFKMVK